MEFPCWVDFGHMHLNHITTPEQLPTYVSTERWVYLPDPGMPCRGYHPARVFDRHRRRRIPYRQYHACEPFAGTHRSPILLRFGHGCYYGSIGRAIPREIQV